jgi:hypothetical protein
MKKLDTTPQLFTKEEAIRIDTELNIDDDWNYVPEHDPEGTGKSRIKVFDETNAFVGYW